CPVGPDESGAGPVAGADSCRVVMLSRLLLSPRATAAVIRPPRSLWQAFPALLRPDLARAGRRPRLAAQSRPAGRKQAEWGQGSESNRQGRALASSLQQPPAQTAIPAAHQ